MDRLTEAQIEALRFFFNEREARKERADRVDELLDMITEEEFNKLFKEELLAEKYPMTVVLTEAGRRALAESENK